jgi:hypothetical protein
MASAQTKKPASQKPEPNTKEVAKEAILSSFESVLSDGKIQFTKVLSWSDPKSAPLVNYTLLARNSSFNNGKPFNITLSKESFDNYFQKSSAAMNERWPRLIGFAQNNRLSYTEEESWIRIINYLNSLF